MIKQESVQKLLMACVEGVIAEMSSDERVEVNLDTLLLAEGGAIDSLQLVSIIVDFEESINKNYNINISLTSDEAMIQLESPFYSVKTLSDYTVKLLIAKSKGD